ncbi:MAG: excisionase [Comamonadaceae bacterium SCN 68-20]|jgi:excisionase family DNA binding protein|nr:response regulator [Comamonadaceae bacterium]ODU59080.1 MAG: excisionase [Comamonadaceae bacterium SCN 68-20]OJX06843.1 MAG: DNA-binding protein [Burkholderiales bacterium 68-20]
MEKDLLNALPEECSTRDVAQALGLAVRSVQLMVDRGELQAWKTPGGHRRITRASVQQWLEHHQGRPASAAAAPSQPPAQPLSTASAPKPSSASEGAPPPAQRRPRVLLIEDSAHFQNLVRLLMAHNFPHVDLHVAEDGFVGLAMAGELQPDVLLVDILLPGIDGATLIARLRSHPQFQRSRLIVVTSLDEAQRGVYAFALTGLPVVHKPQMVQELPPLLKACLDSAG